MSPAEHPQTPEVHTCSAVQATPHAPQLDASEAVITHAPPQRVAPAGQLEVQRPPAQVCPDGHAVPHAPQLEESVAVSTQRPPQSDWPAGHTHAPAEHDCPLAQA